MKISIITVCYNSARTLETAMHSVLSQTWRELEYIVVDGGSQDKTLELIQNFERRWSDARAGTFRWISEPDKGMYDAINKGIRMASGNVIGILHADDVFHDDQVVHHIAMAFKKDQGAAIAPDVVYGDIRFVSHDAGLDIMTVRSSRTIRYYTGGFWRPWMARWGFMPPHPSVYIRRACFLRLGGYSTDYDIAADFALMVRYFCKERLRRKYIRHCIVDMRMGGKSTKGWRSTVLLNIENVRANREAGVFCVLPMMLPKYLVKIWEFVLPRLWKVKRFS